MGPTVVCRAGDEPVSTQMGGLGTDRRRHSSKVQTAVGKLIAGGKGRCWVAGRRESS